MASEVSGQTTGSPQALGSIRMSQRGAGGVSCLSAVETLWTQPEAVTMMEWSHLGGPQNESEAQAADGGIVLGRETLSIWAGGVLLSPNCGGERGPKSLLATIWHDGEAGGDLIRSQSLAHQTLSLVHSYTSNTSKIPHSLLNKCEILARKV